MKHKFNLKLAYKIEWFDYIYNDKLHDNISSENFKVMQL